MTPQERELIDQLFSRLATLESAPRDKDAEAAIRQGLSRAPNAAYALVQTVLVQDEALKMADARIRELEAAGGGQAVTSRSSGFLDSMRSSLWGRRSSVPEVRPAAVAPAAAPAAQSTFGGGSSFLGTAAAAAAGFIGGSLLLGGIRSMFGGGYNYGSPFAGTFDQLGGYQDASSPWSSGAQAGDLEGQDRGGQFDTASDSPVEDSSFDTGFDSPGSDSA